MKHTSKTLKQIRKISPEQNKLLRLIDSRLQAASIPTPKIEEYKAALVRLYMYTDTIADTPSNPNKTCAHLFVFKNTYQGHSYWESLMQALGEG